MLADLRTAARALRRSPGFTVTVVTTLALGIGVSHTLFSFVDAALLRPLPYADFTRLLHVSLIRTSDGALLPASYPDYRDWRDQVPSFESIAGYARTNRTVTGLGSPFRVAVTQVTAGFFATLGVHLAAGREFLVNEERAAESRRVILTHGFWTRHFAATPVLGVPLALNGVSHEIIGVLPEQFTFALDSPDVFVPLGLTDVDETRRDSYWLGVIGRLRPGATRATTAAALSAIHAARPAGSPATAITVTRLQEYVVGPVRTVLLVLLGAALFVTLTAAASAGTLIATRAVNRRRESAVRMALGASRTAILRLGLAELALLGVATAAAAVLIGQWTTTLTLRLVPAVMLARANYLGEAGLDRDVVLFDLVLVALALLPACGILGVETIRGASAQALRAGSWSRTIAGVPLRGAFVAVQVGLALVLVVGAALMVQSVVRLARVPLGFDTDRLLAMNLSVPAQRYPDAPRIASFYAELQRRVAALPGIERAATIDEMPLTRDDGAVSLSMPDASPEAGGAIDALIRSASPGYFETMRIAVRRGRAFTADDTAGRPAVAVVNRALAERLFRDGDPVGRTIALARNAATFQVIGVVDDVRMGEVDRDVRPAFYTCSLQDPSRSSHLIVRTAVAPDAIVAAIRQVAERLDREVPIYRVRTLEQALGETRGVAMRQVVLYPTAVFGVVATVIAVLGVYGLLSYSVTQRTREIGLRMALGAWPGAVLRSAMRQGLRPAVVGAIIGLGIAAIATQLLASVLFGVPPLDVVSFAAATLGVLGLASIACYLAARRAAQVDPVQALRAE